MRMHAGPARRRLSARSARPAPAHLGNAACNPACACGLRAPEQGARHIWRFELSSDAVKILGQQFKAGGQPLTRVRTVGQEAGRVTLRCLYDRPWGQSAREIRTYQIEVT